MNPKKPTVIDVIWKHYPTAKFNIINGDDWENVEWVDEDIAKPSDNEISTKLAEMQSDWEAQEYARNRQPLYPAIGDQLDDLYHAGVFSAEMTATLKKVKDDNPK